MNLTTLIREVVLAEPFRPFVHRVAEWSYSIRHPEFISIGPQNRSLVICHEDGAASMVEMPMIPGIDLPGAFDAI